jgi:hypothetical protein
MMPTGRQASQRLWCCFSPVELGGFNCTKEEEKTQHPKDPTCLAGRTGQHETEPQNPASRVQAGQGVSGHGPRQASGASQVSCAKPQQTSESPREFGFSKINCELKLVPSHKLCMTLSLSFCQRAPHSPTLTPPLWGSRMEPLCSGFGFKTESCLGRKDARVPESSRTLIHLQNNLSVSLQFSSSKTSVIPFCFMIFTPKCYLRSYFS